MVTINRPKSLNALNSETLAELNTCLAEIEGRTDIKVVILTGSGSKSFVAGADISEMVNATPAEGRAMACWPGRLSRRLENMPQVTIAAVNGFALGGGCEISMACTSAWPLKTPSLPSPSAAWASCPASAAPSVWPVWWARAGPRR